MSDAKIIPLFKGAAPPLTEDIGGEVEERINEDFAASIAHVQTSLDQLFLCDTREDLEKEVAAIKDEVSTWHV